MTGKTDRVLLPTDVQPLHYHLHLTPDLKAFVFHGSLLVDLQVKKSTNVIVLHCFRITVNAVHFSAEHFGRVKATNVSYDETAETATFTFEKALPEGKGQLDIDFDGILNDKMKGFYRSKYVLNGEERIMATTQFEPTAARQAFPCWDEPAIKAMFSVTLTYPENLVGLSNMDPVEQKSENGLKTVKFAPSPIMSTYLLAFVIGEFDYVEGKTKDNVRVRIYTPVGRKETGTFALDVAVKTLEFFGEYYGIPYPLPKLDQVAIADFAAGAMENWGLVTYRETALLVDPKNSGVLSRARVAYVVAHELAHQWFGNLVTMEWWKELWLNEGFATFVGTQAVDQLFPEWKYWTQFVSDYVNTAQSLDAMENSHPIEVEVSNSAQIEEIFDAISYNKGASVIRMCCDQIGEAAFRKGLNIYLKRFQYSNAVTTDLWKALGEASGYDVQGFMSAYTQETGYPLLTVESTSNPSQYKVSQRRFIAKGTKFDENQKWWISIPVRSSNGKEVHRYDFKETESTLTFKDTEGAAWVKVNADQSGFFRVKYSSDLSAKLTAPINDLSLGPVDRIGIQGDAFALSLAGFAPLADALNLARAYNNETEYPVWKDLAGNLAKFSAVWKEESNYAQVEKFMVDVFASVGKKFGWDEKDGDSDLDKLLRVLALSQLGNNGHKETIEEAQKRFKNKVPVPADQRGTMYRLVVVNGGKEEYEQVLEIYRTAEMHEEKLKALNALGSTKDPELIKRHQDFILNSKEVRAQDFFSALYPMTATPSGRAESWRWLREKWTEVLALLGDSAGLIDRTIGYTVNGFTSEERAIEVEKFFAEHPVPSAERTVKQAVEAIRNQARWLQENKEGVAKWLNENYPA